MLNWKELKFCSYSLVSYVFVLGKYEMAKI